jgi:hypothetical protein
LNVCGRVVTVSLLDHCIAAHHAEVRQWRFDLDQAEIMGFCDCGAGMKGAAR